MFEGQLPFLGNVGLDYGRAAARARSGKGPGRAGATWDPGKGGSEPLVLILDADADYSEALAAELEAGGVNMEVASEGDEGLNTVMLVPSLSPSGP